MLPLSGPGTEGFHSDVWIALPPNTTDRTAFYFAYARRKPGVTLAQAEADVKQAAAQIASLNPDAHPSYTARLDDLRETSIGTVRPTLLLLFAAAALLLLIACANVAGLLLARAVARARETATRVALGASHRQLALLYFVEGMLVSLAGAAAGVFVSIALVRTVTAIAVEYLPPASAISIDWTVFVFALATAFVASAPSSVAPLWQALRTAPNEVLNAGVRASAGARVRRLSHSLVVAEIALAFTLLAVSALLIAHMQTLTRTPVGFDPHHLLTFELTIADSIAADDATRVLFQKRLVDALEAIPGVTSAGFANQLPLDGCCLGTNVYADGGPRASDAAERNGLIIASPGYVRTMNIPLRRGRLLDERDTSEELLHVLINEAASRRYWPGRDPLDGRGRLGGPDGTPFRVIGVIGDVRNDSLGKPTVPEVYLLNAVTAINPMLFAVRSTVPVETLLPAVRQAIRTVDPKLPLHGGHT